ncbi:MAG TPA: HD domain-containing phosphohydrolase [Gemmatimonadales bacterium]
MPHSAPPPAPIREPDRGPVGILVVDDEEPIRNALRRFLAQEKYEVVTAATGAEALAAVGRHRVGCVLLDLRLPDEPGTDLVPQLLDADPDLAILVLTAVNDAATAALCLQRGALDYLVKPVDLADLLRAVQRVLRRRDARLESQRLNSLLREEVALRTAELQQERESLQRLAVATLEALVNALEAKDRHLRGHSARVADLAAKLATASGMPEEQVETVRTAGRLHDIGKIGIRESILNKQGPLTDDEFAHVKTHTLVGAQILAPLGHLADVIGYVRSHHERWDGKGYPDGLAAEAIPVGARIIGAVEIFDALTTSRPYQETMSPRQAVERMADLVGTVIDPSVHDALDRVVNRK